jgi:cytochrome c-type biogenesis protein CcmH
MLRALALALITLLAVQPLALAAPQTTVQEVEREVMCVTCGVPLVVAESPAADAQRREIRRLVDAGLTKSQVEDRLVAIYGDGVLALPKDTGLSVVAYLLPVGLVLLAAVLVGGAVRTWGRRSSADDEPAPPTTLISAESAARLEADLARYEQ